MLARRFAPRKRINVPIYIQRRQYQLRNYVLESLFPESDRNNRIKRMEKSARKDYVNKMNEIVNECTFVCYIFFLKQFFIEGSNAAKNAVDTFKEFNVDGFNIGNKKFEGRNEAVLEGDNLYQELLNNITNEKLKSFIMKTAFFSEIINEYKNVPI